MVLADSYGYLRTESYYHVVLGVVGYTNLFVILSPRNPLLSTYFKAHFLTKPLPKLNFLLLQLAQQTSASILSSSISRSKKRLRDGSFSSAASFHSYITLLDEMLQQSRVDGIPIIIVISDVEAFASRKSTHVEK
jgi:hypothetical protein